MNSVGGTNSDTINQRFFSKEQLWYAAVDHGFRRLIADINAELEQFAPHDDMSLLRNTFRAYLVASWRRPEMTRLMNQEGLHSTARLDHIVVAGSDTVTSAQLAYAVAAARALPVELDISPTDLDHMLSTDYASHSDTVLDWCLREVSKHPRVRWRFG